MSRPKGKRRKEQRASGGSSAAAKTGPKSRRGFAAALSRMDWGLVLVGLVLVGFAAHAWAFRFVQDDAFISLRYAKNLVDGHGLVFNPGERVEGYSNFSWTLLLALLIKLGAPPIQIAGWMGIVFGLGAVFLTAKLARDLEGRWGPASFGAAALVAASPAFAYWTSAGLETALYAFLVAAAMERGLTAASPRARIAAPLLFSAAALTRPDGPMYFAMWFTIRVFDTIRKEGPGRAEGGARELARDVILFVAPLIPYAIWKLVYFGDLLPNTYHAKAGLSAQFLGRGIDYARKYFDGYAIWGVVPAFALLSLARGHLRSVEARLLLVWLGVAAYIVVIGGDVLRIHRFWLPVLPIGAVLVARGVTWAAEWFAKGRAQLAWTSATAVIAGIVAVGFAQNWGPSQEAMEKEIGFVTNMTRQGKWFREHLEPGSTIAIATVGAIAYYSERNVIDLLGLTDAEVARNPLPVEGLSDTWRETVYNAESVLSRRPDAVLFSTGVRPSSAAEKALFLYEWFHDSYYQYLFRSIPEQINIQVVFRLKPDAEPYHDGRLEYESLDFIDEYKEAHIKLGREQNWELAAEYFERTIQLAPDFRWAREWWAACIDELGDPRGAEVLKEIVAEDPYALTGLNRLGDAAMRRGDGDVAAAYFEKVREIDPDDSTPWMALSELARREGDYETAYRLAQQGVRLWNAHPQYVTVLGNYAAHFGDLQLAENCYLRALGLEPGYPQAQRGLDALKQARQQQGQG